MDDGAESEQETEEIHVGPAWLETDYESETEGREPEGEIGLDSPTATDVLAFHGFSVYSSIFEVKRRGSSGIACSPKQDRPQASPTTELRPWTGDRNRRIGSETRSFTAHGERRRDPIRAYAPPPTPQIVPTKSQTPISRPNSRMKTPINKNVVSSSSSSVIVGGRWVFPASPPPINTGTAREPADPRESSSSHTQSHVANETPPQDALTRAVSSPLKAAAAAAGGRGDKLRSSGSTRQVLTPSLALQVPFSPIQPPKLKSFSQPNKLATSFYKQKRPAALALDLPEGPPNSGPPPAAGRLQPIKVDQHPTTRQSLITSYDHNPGSQSPSLYPYSHQWQKHFRSLGSAPQPTDEMINLARMAVKKVPHMDHLDLPDQLLISVSEPSPLASPLAHRARSASSPTTARHDNAIENHLPPPKSPKICVSPVLTIAPWLNPLPRCETPQSKPGTASKTHRSAKAVQQLF